MEVELDNFRAALAFGVEHEPVLALRTAAALGYFWARRAGPSEGRRWLELAIERVETLPGALQNPVCQAPYARAWGWLGQTAMAGGNNLLAGRCFARAADLAEATGDTRTRAMAIGLSGLLELTAGNVEAAGRHLQEGIDLLRAQNDRVILPMALGTMGRYWMITGRDDEARACAEEAIDLAVETGNRWFAAWSYMTLGWSDKGHGAFDRAKQNLDEGLAIFSEMGDKHFANVARSSVADMARLSGDRDTARKLYQQIMLAWRDLGNLGAVARCLECLAFLEVPPADLGSQGSGAPCDDESAVTRCSDAARLLGAAATLRRRHAAPMAAYEEEEHRTHVAALQACAGSEAFAEAWASGEALALDDAFTLALQAF
jgi:tetratricopeptide (TPR) repeat protein